ncbi:DUF192 domain-containing protein [Glaciimonas sp. CA11.2]|uniref:DUF192 domain-containing protein n=1 Tax=unclassified Glaciimonas TaxID=2644401 RepID=UPI002AB5AA00|nr:MULTISPECIES: DUF192 domain-containing protein [unclassified Glaciimonas]MDY7547378.1 DUF192 domain-containing protein [Glaciimonas sp. CA11.2]MEB0013607.1 DUF192 domain-containing protein [Glaciimonas sp. Cout2]MEB0083192.1 DUF192 domain-containing protein [Glaciimonas sp. Gout2]MEB0165329.1 DUF192 domain-containing protein [Glaciimonas sp. CA11.2]
MRRYRPSTAVMALALLGSTIGVISAATAQGTQQFPVVSLNAGIHVIKAEVATTEAQREQGLMFRKQLASNAGMVFLFDAPAGVCMWMKNTLIPLSVAFLDQNGVIINIEEMKAQTLDSHCAEKAALYALEMNPGWFKQKNLKPGTAISGLPRAQ